jgi:uroporphyrin-III C-methyltransferase
MQKRSTSSRNGKVYLIGAGPGAADLITVRGARILAQAQVVLHDALVSQEMLELCPQAKKIPVGKRCGQFSTAQHFINKQMIDAAHKHAIVVRLKGGDPMLFGRAEEELSALENAGIVVEIVPGITTALAAAAASQQPLTQRGVARSVALFTSATAPGESRVGELPNCDSLVQYMGGAHAVATARQMLAQGYPASLPVLIVENCSLPQQRIVRTSLSQVTELMSDISGPVLVMIGESFRSRHQVVNIVDFPSDTISGNVA